MTLDPTFVLANYLEAGVWAGIGLVALIKRNGYWSLVLGVTLILFGVSDIVETRTGAWYEPWWLLSWKALAVMLILISGFRVLQVCRRRSA